MAASGSFIVTSNTGSFTVSPTFDILSEGAETFTVSIRTESTTGTIVATSNTVTINDIATSLYLDPNNITSYPGTGNIYTDLSGNGRDFTRSAGTFVSSPIKSWSGGVFTRTNYLGTDTTIQAWINTTNIGNTGGATHRFLMQIMSAELSGNPTNPTDFGFGINGSGALAGKLSFGTGGSDVTVSSNTSVNTGTWTNVAVTRTESTGVVKLYINGVLDKTGNCNASAGALTAQTTLSIGTGGDGGKTWIGLMGIISTYPSVLSDANILLNYNNTKATYGL